MGTKLPYEPDTTKQCAFGYHRSPRPRGLPEEPPSLHPHERRGIEVDGHERKGSNGFRADVPRVLRWGKTQADNACRDGILRSHALHEGPFGALQPERNAGWVAGLQDKPCFPCLSDRQCSNAATAG